MKERELFLAALDIEDPAARQAHLKAECGGDAELLARVESLLASHEGQSQFLKTPVVEQIADVSGSVASATIAYESGFTHDDDPEATTAYSRGAAPMTKHDDDSEFEIALGYLEPSTKPGSLGRLAHYEVLEVVGRGAFGTVLRAFDEKLQRVVAIKVMAPEMAATSPARKRFLREAQSSAAIRHEHVVSVYAVEEKPLPYLVMEFIPGQTLQQRLDQAGPLDVPTVLRIGRQIAEGLAAAHAQDLIHRDIKPANILLETGAREMVKVTDFGLARAADDASLTQSGMIAGTPMYMAPEQAMGNKLDQRADLFSFGSVLYQMVSGRPPFRANGTLAVLKRLAEDTPRPIREIIPETPQWLCDIITKLHAKNPDERYQSAREIADVLANCESQLKAHSGLKDFSLIPQAKTPPANFWKWIAAAVVVLPLAAFGLSVLNRPAAKPELVETGTIKPQTPGLITSESDPSLIATASQKTPPPAVAPFDATQARAHQEAWAKHLGVPVEYTNSIGMKFVLIPPGEFTMGNTQEGMAAGLKNVSPNHKVILTQSIYLGVNEVTQAEYEKVMGVNPSHFAPLGIGKEAVAGLETAEYPVEEVSWNDAAEFCAKLSKQEKLKPFYFRAGETIEPLDGTGYRLPSEAEWEFACRAGTATKHWIGDKDEDLMRAGWFKGNSGGRTHAAGELKANPFGLADIHGNVWEWVQDGWDATFDGQFQDKPAINPNIPFHACSQRVLRGGHWGDTASNCQSSNRLANVPTNRNLNLGFRVSLPVDAVKAAIAGSNTISSVTTTATAKRRYASDEWIDVIPLIDPQTDKWDVPQRTGKNAWRLEGTELVSDKDQLASKLILPLDSDWPAFECELEFTRRAGDSGFNVNLPTKIGECPLVVDPPGTGGGVSLGARGKGTLLATVAQIVTGQRATLRVEVRHQQDSDHMAITINDAKVGDWTGNRNTIANTYKEGFPHDRRLSLWINPDGNEFVFHRIRVRMLDGGTAESLRPAPSPAPVPAVVQALRELVAAKDSERDQAKQSFLDGQLSKLDLVYAELDATEARIQLTQAEQNVVANLAAFRRLVAFREQERELIVQQLKAGVVKEDVLERTDSGLADARGRLGKAIAEAPSTAFFTEADAQRIASLPTEQQVEEVCNELVRRNPGFDGKAEHKIEAGVVTELKLITDEIVDVSPVRALQGLVSLKLSATPLPGKRGKLSDISPLGSLRLTHLDLGCTEVTNIEVVREMPLKDLSLDRVPVTDLSPLTGKVLKSLHFGGTKVKSLSEVPIASSEVIHCHLPQISDKAELQRWGVRFLDLWGVPTTVDPERLRELKPPLSRVNGKPLEEFLKEAAQK